MGKGLVLAVTAALSFCMVAPVVGDPDQAGSRDVGRKISAAHPAAPKASTNNYRDAKPRVRPAATGSRRTAPVPVTPMPHGPKPGSAPTGTVALPMLNDFSLLSRDPLQLLRLESIRPLYTSPGMPGEGVWQSADTPRDMAGTPVIYTTFYRPSVEFPNATVYMMVVDTSKASMRYYVGSQEPGAALASSEVEPAVRTRVLAVTNAMWMQRHSMGAGAIYRGKFIYPMVDGMATLIVYKDGSIDIQEWSSDIPLKLVRDARQLRHLIVKNGMVVKAIVREGRLEDSEIGLGFLLGRGGKNYEGENHWYVAHRSAFGIRKDGNLVFAIGHHIGSRDMAKALVLAGCERGIHADANPANIVANLYLRDSRGVLVRKMKLSPEQSSKALERYDEGYSKDFFAFVFRTGVSPGGRALTRRSTPVGSHP